MGHHLTPPHFVHGVVGEVGQKLLQTRKWEFFYFNSSLFFTICLVFFIFGFLAHFTHVAPPQWSIPQPPQWLTPHHLWPQFVLLYPLNLPDPSMTFPKGIIIEFRDFPWKMVIFPFLAIDRVWFVLFKWLCRHFLPKQGILNILIWTYHHIFIEEKKFCWSSRVLVLSYVLKISRIWGWVCL